MAGCVAEVGGGDAWGGGGVSKWWEWLGEWGVGWEGTVEAQDIVHVSGCGVAVHARVDEEDLSTDTGETAQCAETGWASADDDGIIVDCWGTGLGDGSSVDY